MTTANKWKWFGDAGHFICSYKCKFHICTQVGKYLISTVGKMPRGNDMASHDYAEIGCDRLYETLMFRLGTEKCSEPHCNCGLPIPSDWGEIDGDGYNDAGAANRGHLALCKKYARRTK